MEIKIMRIRKGLDWDCILVRDHLKIGPNTNFEIISEINKGSIFSFKIFKNMNESNNNNNNY